MYQIRTQVYNLFQENTRILWKEPGRCVVVDPGFYKDSEQEQFFSTLKALGLSVEAVLLTHGHFDHIFGVKAVQDAFGCKVYMNPEENAVLGRDNAMISKLGIRYADTSFISTPVREGDVVSEAGFNFKVIETPGHTPGGVSYLEEAEKIVFTGDTLFAGTIGRTDFSYSDYDKEILSFMEKLILLDPDTTVLPGHGPSTTIGHERTHNPMLEPFNEPEETFDEDLPGISITR